MKNNLKIVFFGTPNFGKVVLERLIESSYKPILVVTQPDQPVGRKQIITPPPVKILAEQHKIAIFQPKIFGESETKRLKAMRYELAVVVAYGKIIPKAILKIPKYGTLNIHPSLLPRWRGPSPIQYSLLYGDKETGVTIMLMDEEIDHGPIVANSKFEILNSKFTTVELSKKLAEIGAELLIQTIPKWIEGEIKPIEQNHAKATYAKILTKDDGHIDWNKPAEEIERQIRAFTPWPGSFTNFGSMRIKITDGYASSKNSIKKLLCGETSLFEGDKISVQTGKGTFVVRMLQPEGKTEMSAKKFLNGHPDIANTVLK